MSVLNLHIASIFFAVGVILFADKEAFAWMRGTKQTLSHKPMHVIHVLMWVALLALIVTGIILLVPQASYLLVQPLFIIKMLFVGVLVVNALLIGNLMHVALTRPYATLLTQEKVPLFVSGGVSVFSWASVIVIGLYLFY